jgi:hypothetical protein
MKRKVREIDTEINQSSTKAKLEILLSKMFLLEHITAIGYISE